MAKYTVTYKCGHTRTVELFGRESERDRKIAWYKEFCSCPECYAAEQAAKREAEAQKYALPELVGTEKQVAWAEKIRSKFIETRDEQAKYNEKLYETPNVPKEQIEQHKRLFADFCKEYFGETKASVWIDRENADEYLRYKFANAFAAYVADHI